MKPIEICQANKGICKMHVFGKICPLDPFQGGFYCPDTCEHKIDGVCTVRGFFLSKMTGRRTCLGCMEQLRSILILLRR